MWAALVVVGVLLGALAVWLWGPATVNGAETLPQFDGPKAYAQLQAQCDIGVRAPGTPGHDACKKYIMDQLAAMKVEHREQAFTGGPDDKRIPMANVVAHFAGRDDSTIVLGAHYDTKTFFNIKFIGANDGASGVAVLLELARTLSQATRSFPHGIDLVFIDGEEAVAQEWMGVGLYGSHEYVKQAHQSGADKKIRAFILLDMIGDRELHVTEDTRSTPWLRKLVFDTAASLGYKENFNGPQLDVIDDHVPFLQDNIASVDLIDFDYGSMPGLNDYWHTEKDTADKCSPQSLEVIGRVIQATLVKLEK